MSSATPHLSRAHRALAAAIAAAGVVVVLAHDPAASRAAVTISSNLAATPNAGHTDLVGLPTHAHSVLPIASTAPGGVVAPSDGVVVRWRIKVGFSASPVALRITRPGTSNTRTGAGTGPTVTPAVNATSTYPVRLPIEAGDALGIDCCEGVQLQAFVTGTTHRFWVPRLEDGAAPRASFEANFEMLINADIEPDADRDGYGDETQDGCPTDASSHGACPNSPPGGGAQPALELTLDAKRKQKPKKLKVDVGCGAVECSVELGGKGKVPRASGAALAAAKAKKFKLKPKQVELAPGATETVRLKFRKHKKSVKQIKRVLKQGGKRARRRAKAVVKATATAAGGTATAKQKVKLK